MSAKQRKDFAEASGAQKVMYQRWIVPYLPPKDRALYDRLVAGDAWKEKERIEQALISAPATSSRGVETLPSELSKWDDAYKKINPLVTELNTSRTQGLLAHGFERAAQIRTHAYQQIAIGACVLILLACLIFSSVITVARRSKQVSELAETAAQELLPNAVDALQHGRQADLSQLPEPVQRPRDEFDHITNAVALLAQQAANSAETVYAERKGFAAFTLGVSTRAWAILDGKLLPLLDQLEGEHAQDPQLLEQLYGVDHIAMRVRRLLENLRVLSGGELDHSHERPVHVANLLMNAAGESFGFERVIKDFRAEAWIVGHAADELTHLLAELVENAATFSPPQYEITVRSVEASAGVAIEVEDRGHPLKDEHLSELNARLTKVSLYGALIATDERLGLFTVGQLAKRLGVTVTLTASRFRGVLATILIPHALLTEPPQLPAPVTPQVLPPEVPTTASGLVKRIPPARADQGARRAQHVTPVRDIGGGPDTPARGRQAPSRHGESGLPQRVPFTHLAAQLRGAPTTPSSRLALDTRPLEEIDFSALDDIKHTPNGEHQ